MALHNTGLGKGLDALIRETSSARPEKDDTRALPVNMIVPNPHQPRREFDPKALEELAESIRSQGLLQPILVRPLGGGGKYEIVAGERRWRASQLAGLKEVPVFIRSFSAQDTLIAALIENLQREDLNPVEEALGLQTLKEEYGLSQEDLAKKLGKSRSAIANSLRLLALPESIRELLASGTISAGHARALLSITNIEAQEALKDIILEKNLSVRESEGLASTWKETGSFASGATSDEVGSQDTPSPDPKTKKARPQSARLLEIQSRIEQVLQTQVKVTGKEDKGRISLAYNSQEELEALLARLSGNVLEGQSFPSLSGSENVQIAETARKSLSGDQSEALPHRKSPVLSGNTHEALDAAPERVALTGQNNEKESAGNS